LMPGVTRRYGEQFLLPGKGEMIRLLLDAGADRNLKNSSGVSPLELAATIGNYDVRQLFIE
jgi:uncharacterized protein